MFKSLFTNRFFIGALAIFIFCVVGSLLYMWGVERQKAEHLAETQGHIEQFTERQNPQPAEPQSSVADTSQGEHFHEDGTLSAEPHDRLGESEQMSTVKTEKIRRPFSEMPPEERLKAIEDWYRQSGLELPPEGYRYIWLEPGIPKRDDNGNPILWKRDEPFFEVITAIGFAPTREEFTQYQQMKKDRLAAIMRGDDVEADRLLAALKRFRKEHRGEIPSVFGRGGKPGVDYTEEIHQKLHPAYREAGYDYLIPDKYR